jgi:hypothetical protein
MTQALQKIDELPLAVRPQPTVADMLSAVIQGGVTNENIAALERMTDLYERMESKKAEQKFNAAFAALQSELPDIVASSIIPNRGKYERFEDIMYAVKPLLVKHGFAVSFEQLADDKRIRVTCHLRHADGHSTSTPFAVRLGGKADSDTQADCKASTTAKRNALTQALNIVVRQDAFDSEDDAKLEGGFITLEQADELERRVALLNVDRVAFLKFAGAATFKEIPSSKYDLLDQQLAKKERK